MVHRSSFEENSLQNIPEKAGKLLSIFFVLFCLLGLRLWHIGVKQHEKLLSEAFSPRKKVVVEHAPRGTIRDRFNVVLAKNSIEYRLSCVYADIRKIPAVAKDPQGKKVFPRKEYISKLATLIHSRTNLDKERVEDLIHSHAAMYDTLPLVLQRGLKEEDYYYLRARMKDYPGLVVEATSKRVYPCGKVGAHAVGFVGPLPKAEFENIYTTLRRLTEYVQAVDDGLDVPPPGDLGVTSFSEAKEMLIKLKEKVYALNDRVGVMGIEASAEKELRGYVGKRIFFSDAKGSFLRELPGSRAPIAGKRVYLTISSELQKYAEELLITSEKDRKERKRSYEKEPEVLGGAIIAIDPATGEVLALASSPRFNPNDFQETNDTDERKLLWVANERYASKVWDGKLPLVYEEMEKAHEAVEINETLSWQKYLDLVLPENTILHEKIGPQISINKVIVAEKAFSCLLEKCPTLPPSDIVKLVILDKQDSSLQPYVGILRDLFRSFDSEQDVLLFLDLGRLLIQSEKIGNSLFEKIEPLAIEKVRTISQEYAVVEEMVRQSLFEAFRKTEFKKWKEKNEKEFLQKKRREEREQKKAAKPYLDYLDAVEALEWQSFWKGNREKIIAKLLQQDEEIKQCAPNLVQELLALNDEEGLEFLKSLRTFQDLTFQLYGTYPGIDGDTGKKLVMGMLKAFGANSLRSYAFRQSSIQGSIFKLVTAYAGLRQAYNEKESLHLFEITDKTFSQERKEYVGYFANGEKIPRLYKEGRIPKSIRPNFGKMDVVRALTLSSNVYFSLLAGDYLHDSEQLIHAAKLFGYGKKTGIFLPGELCGSVPTDVQHNKTGLYATAIGQHTLVTTPLQTSMMLSAIANGGTLYSPQIVRYFVGQEIPSQDIREKQKEFLFKKPKKNVQFPFQVTNNQEREVVQALAFVKRKIFMPKEIQEVLFQGMLGSIHHVREDVSLLERMRIHHPEVYTAFKESQGHFIGKTSTSEVIERVGIGKGTMYRHVWFGGISEDPETKKPDLIVVVYLRFGGYGKEVAPYAAAVAEKWRDIKSKY